MISKTTLNSINYSGRNIKAKNSQTKPKSYKKTAVVTTAIAVGTFAFLSYKGVFGSKLQNFVNTLISNVKSLFNNSKKDSLKPDQTPVVQGSKIPNDVVEIPLKNISDLNNKANSLRQELISVTSGENGLEEMFAKLSCTTEINSETTADIVKITSKANELEGIILEYNGVMEENNGLVDKFKNGRRINDIAQKQYYINMIQRAYQLQEILKYDEKGVSISSDALQSLIDSWI